MKPYSETPVTVWTSRLLFVLLAGWLIWPWATAESGATVLRGNQIAGVHVHLFFRGLASVCFLGLGYTFVPGRRARLIAGASLLLAFTGVWFSFSLMMIGAVPTWLWLVLSVLWLALPIALAVALFGQTPRVAWLRLWMLSGLSVALAAIGLVVAQRPFVISIHKVAIRDADRWVTARDGLNRFRYDFMLWSLAGGPPHSLYEDEERHREALVRLGYFGQTNFGLRHARVRDVDERARQTALADPLWTIDLATNQQAFRLTAYRGDMPLWESIVAKADLDKAQAGSSSHPIRSETNRTSPAASSRR